MMMMVVILSAWRPRARGDSPEGTRLQNLRNPPAAARPQSTPRRGWSSTPRSGGRLW